MMKNIIFIFICSIIISCGTNPKKKYTFEWKNFQTNTKSSLRGLSVVNDSTVWVTGSNSTVLRTLNGGREWEKINLPITDSIDIRDVEAFDENTALVLSAGSPAYILKTIDGGINWKIVYENHDKRIFFNAMTFWDKHSGIAAGDPIDHNFSIIKTVDGGENWNAITANKIPKPLNKEAGFAASGTCLFTGVKKDIYLLTGGTDTYARILYSKDFGKSWTATKTPIKTGHYSKGLFTGMFFNKKDGIVLGGDFENPFDTLNNIALTNNGGLSWKKNKGSVPKGFRSCVSLSKKTGVLIAVGSHGIDYSLDYGQNWNNLDTIGFHVIQFDKNKPNTAYLAGSKGRVSKLIIKTKD